MRRFKAGAALLLVLMAVSAAPRPSGEDPFPMKGPGGDPMHLPTEILSLPGGRAAMLDGAKGRLAFFSADGTFERYAGEEAGMDHALGFCLLPDRRILVTDTERGALLLFDDRGTFLRPYSIEFPDLDYLPKPSGAACDPDSNVLYVTDLANHAVHCFSLPEFAHIRSMVLERELGTEEAYPLSPRWHKGVLYLVEPLNGRIRKLDADGRLLGFVGSRGTGEGRLFRPKGLAIEKDENLLVSDSFQGTVLRFTPEGAFLGRLERGLGQGTFYTPWGIASSDNALWVVEMSENRAIRLESAALQRPESGLLQAHETDEASILIEEVEGDRLCSICHPGEQAGEEPGSPAMCLSCHDGSITDSRTGAFAQHGHRPGGGEENALECMTCHQAHGVPGGMVKEADMATAIFLRLPGARGTICLNCHQAEPAAIGGTVHPLGRFEALFPEELVRLGAAPPRGDAAAIDCRTCHVPHGPGSRLLVGEESGGPCRACHGDLHSPPRPHGPAERFSCWDCHRAHGPENPGMLHEMPGGGVGSCLACHPGQAAVIGSKHAPEEAMDPCLTCHLPFEKEGGRGLFALAAKEGEPPSTGRCRACHGSTDRPDAGDPAAPPHPGGEWLFLDATPPGAGPILGDGPVGLSFDCVLCHDPHAGERPPFLRSGAAQAYCAPCHGPAGLRLFLEYHPREPQPILNEERPLDLSEKIQGP